MPDPSQGDPNSRQQNTDTDTHDASDVRAGPGDAGRQDRPEPMPDHAAARADTWRRAITLIAALLVIALLIGFFL